jgi:hypothetical protein
MQPKNWGGQQYFCSRKLNELFNNETGSAASGEMYNLHAGYPDPQFSDILTRMNIRKHEKQRALKAISSSLKIFYRWNLYTRCKEPGVLRGHVN